MHGLDTIIELNKKAQEAYDTRHETPKCRECGDERTLVRIYERDSLDKVDWFYLCIKHFDSYRR